MLRYEIGVPMDCLGNTAGELNRRGAIMENLRTNDGLQCFDAEIPASQLEPFRIWLATATGGKGRITPQKIV